MEQRNENNAERGTVRPSPSGGNNRRGLFAQPRKAVSGMVYSGAIIGMLLISLAFSVTVAILSAVLERPVDDLAATDAYKYMSYLLYQIVYVALILVFIKIYGEKPRQFGYRLPHWKYWLIALPLAFGLLFSLNWVNNRFVELLSLIGYELPESSLPSVSGGGIVGVLVVVAVLPAFCEETLFRGIILDGIKDIGTVAACLLGGLLFSIFHQNPAQTVYQFICGAVFTLIALRADSILPAVFMHFINNAVILFDYKFDFLSKISSAGTIAMYVVSGVCLVGSLVYLIFFDKKTNRKKEGAIKPFMLAALAGVILCGIMWISVLVDNMG